MSIKRILAALLSVTLLIPSLAACKSGSDAPAVTTQGSETVTTTTVQEGETPDPNACETHTPSAGGGYCTVCYEILKSNEREYLDMIYFACDDATLTDAYKIALADCFSNVKRFKGGLLSSEKEVIIAGADYTTPWTRDGSINVWNAFALLNPEVSKNTLLSLLKQNGTDYLIDGQYWDAIIWAIGAYQYVLVNEDKAFLRIAQNAIETTLAKFEAEEFDAADGLFRGGAVYADGIAAYPDQYANGPNSGIEGWLQNPDNAELKADTGVGLPMKALSTNCTYYQSYVILAEMNKMLNLDAADATAKAEALKAAINKAFWNEEKGTYDYLAYECDYQEAIGIAFVLLFGIADERQTALVLENTYVTEQGIACVWPSFDRYLERDGYGRHAGTIWPHGQGFWARAAFENGYVQAFESELYSLAEKAVRDGQFYEIYHPDTGEVYGGLQGFGKQDISLWGSCSHQTWSATAYLSCIYYEVIGAKIESGKVTFMPYLPTGVNEATVSGLKIGETTFDIVIVRGGEAPSEATYETTESGTVRVVLSVQ
ncbi:MAG: hypothetical protein IJX47_06575 [Clostridia bacterium]|nr:hypothetical protein [Clostridia bacterium]